VGLDSSIICQGCRDYLGSIIGVSELKVLFNYTLDDLLQLLQVGCGNYDYWGGLPVLSGVVSSWGLASVLEESVSMLDALRGAKKFRVGTVLVVVFTAAESAVCTAFFKVGVDSLELCRLRLLTSLKPSSSVVFDWPAGACAFSKVFNSCRATVYVPYRALNRVF
jgi:hypothetical protein